MEGGCVLSSDSASRLRKNVFMPSLTCDPWTKLAEPPHSTPLDENRDKLLDTTLSLESEREALTKQAPL